MGMIDDFWVFLYLGIILMNDEFCEFFRCWIFLMNFDGKNFCLGFLEL